MNKRILFYRYNSICEPSVIHALVELGCKVDELTEEMTNKSLSPKYCLKLVSNKLNQTNYDAVFSINFFPVVSEVCNIYKIPYICWTVDCPIMELYSDTIKNPCNRIFLFDHAQYQEFAPKNPNCIFYLPLASEICDKTGDLDDTNEYQLLIRLLKERTIIDDDGSRRIRKKEEV